MLKNIFSWGRDREVLPEKLTYQEARDALESHSSQVRKELASREEVEPEILYYLAEDGSADIRALVAANPNTPQQANLILADDENEEVRYELAAKISRLIPHLSENETEKTRDLAIEVIAKLASDHLTRVRQILAEEIKDSNLVPPHIVKKMAFDLEEIVSIPIIQYSPLLSDLDLMEIISSAPTEGAIKAIACRPQVSEDVSDAVIGTKDVPAVAALLGNDNAQIREETLDNLLDYAETIDAWHQPLVSRPELSMRAIRRIAGFVSLSLINVLAERNDLDDGVEVYLRRRVRARIDQEHLSSEDADALSEVRQIIQEAMDAGTLDDEFLLEAIEEGNKELVMASLEVLSSLPYSLVERMIASKNAKVVTALVWKAGLSMRLAYAVQQRLAKIHHNQLLPAKGGVDYPLTVEEMNWHLDYFGVDTEQSD